MKEEKKASPISVLLGWGKPYHGKFIGSVVLAVFGHCLSDGALFLCGAYRHNDVGRGAGFFPLCDSLHGRTLRLPGESAVFQSVNDYFPYSGLLHAAGYPGEADRENGPRSDGDDPGYSVRSV